MKKLLVIAHYFKPEQNGVYSSLNENKKDTRKKSLETTLLSWRSYLSEPAVLDIAKKCFHVNQSVYNQLDIVLLLNNNNHLATHEMARKYQLEVINVDTKNPRLLPFAAHKVMESRMGAYDWYLYAEEDLVLSDSLFLEKLRLFQDTFGLRRVLLPHRFELNPNGARFKTYIDGDLRHEFIDKFMNYVTENCTLLTQTTTFGDIQFIRAKNPHSGFFCLSSEQLNLWVKSKYFMDMDCSFVSPLESAATLSILKNFSIFKPLAPHMDYFELQHLDHKFSSLNIPIATSKANSEASQL